MDAQVEYLANIAKQMMSDSNRIEQPMADKFISGIDPATNPPPALPDVYGQMGVADQAKKMAELDALRNIKPYEASTLDKIAKYGSLGLLGLGAVGAFGRNPDTGMAIGALSGLGMSHAKQRPISHARRQLGQYNSAVGEAGLVHGATTAPLQAELDEYEASLGRFKDVDKSNLDWSQLGLDKNKLSERRMDRLGVSNSPLTDRARNERIAARGAGRIQEWLQANPAKTQADAFNWLSRVDAEGLSQAISFGYLTTPEGSDSFLGTVGLVRPESTTGGVNLDIKTQKAAADRSIQIQDELIDKLGGSWLTQHWKGKSWAERLADFESYRTKDTQERTRPSTGIDVDVPLLGTIRLGQKTMDRDTYNELHNLLLEQQDISKRTWKQGWQPLKQYDPWYKANVPGWNTSTEEQKASYMRSNPRP